MPNSVTFWANAALNKGAYPKVETFLICSISRAPVLSIFASVKGTLSVIKVCWNAPVPRPIMVVSKITSINIPMEIAAIPYILKRVSARFRLIVRASCVSSDLLVFGAAGAPVFATSVIRTAPGICGQYRGPAHSARASGQRGSGQAQRRQAFRHWQSRCRRSTG